jgi:hypothetical protein
MLSLPGVDVAAAYVERDLDMRVGRFMSDPSQNYAGLLVTLKN